MKEFAIGKHKQFKIQMLCWKRLKPFLSLQIEESHWMIGIHLEGGFGDNIESEHVNHMADVLLIAQTHGIRLDNAQRRIHRKQCARDSHHLDWLFLRFL